MLKTAVRNTRKLIRATSQAENIRLGRFFTKRDTAARMAEIKGVTMEEILQITHNNAKRFYGIE